VAAPIQPISPAAVAGVASTIRPAASPATDPAVFQRILAGAANQVETTRADANLRIQNFLNGENEELHQVVLATQQAEISLELFQQVRNKVVQAYSEIMRMQM
jgi:flagellar hook-basal body complex protein FliE